MNDIDLNWGSKERKPINIRAGFYHVHSGEYECGMAYQVGYWEYAPCSKLLNHEGECGYADNTAY